MIRTILFSANFDRLIINGSRHSNCGKDVFECPKHYQSPSLDISITYWVKTSYDQCCKLIMKRGYSVPIPNLFLYGFYMNYQLLHNYWPDQRRTQPSHDLYEYRNHAQHFRHAVSVGKDSQATVLWHVRFSIMPMPSYNELLFLQLTGKRHSHIETNLFLSITTKNIAFSQLSIRFFLSGTQSTNTLKLFRNQHT